jgi:hypothetical protein
LCGIRTPKTTTGKATAENPFAKKAYQAFEALPEESEVDSDGTLAHKFRGLFHYPRKQKTDHVYL